MAAPARLDALSSSPGSALASGASRARTRPQTGPALSSHHCAPSGRQPEPLLHFGQLLRDRTLAIYDTNDPETIIVEQEALGTSASTGEFALPNIVVLTVRNGQVARLRDYVNILAAAAAMGRDM